MKGQIYDDKLKATSSSNDLSAKDIKRITIKKKTPFDNKEEFIFKKEKPNEVVHNE